MPDGTTPALHARSSTRAHGIELRGWIAALCLAAPLALGAGCDRSAHSALPDSTLVAVLTDLHMLDARREAYGDAGLDTDSLRAALLAEHGLDSVAFGAVLDGAASEPARLRSLYDSVIVRVNEQSSTLRRQL